MPADSASEGVWQRVEEPFLDLGRFPFTPTELLVQGLVLMRQMARYDDAHDADQVTPPSGSDMRNAESVHLDLAPRLRSGRHLDRVFAVDGRDGDGVAEHRL